MLSVERLTVKPVRDVTPGQLVLIELGGSRYFGLRVVVAGHNDSPADAVLLLQFQRDDGKVLPTAFEKCGDWPCIPLGSAVVRMSRDALTENTPDDDQGRGHLIIHDGGVAISGLLRPDGWTKRNWSVTDGAMVKLGALCERFTHWSIGTQQGSGPYVPVATYPVKPAEPIA